MAACKICGGDFKESPDKLVVCTHKEGAVHQGCCCDNCSGNGKPCDHSQGVYEKQEE